MSKRKIIMALAAVVLLLPALFVSSCKKAENGSLAVQLDTTVLLGFKGGTFKVPVLCTGTWTASSDSNHLMIAPGSCKGACKLSITVPPSADKFEKKFRVFVSSAENPSNKAVINITQASAPYIYFDSETVEAPYSGGTVEVKLHSNDKWKLTKGQAYKKYLDPQVSEGEGDLLFTIKMPAATGPSPKKRTEYTFSLVDYTSETASLNIVQIKPKQ